MCLQCLCGLQFSQPGTFPLSNDLTFKPLSWPHTGCYHFLTYTATKILCFHKSLSGCNFPSFFPLSFLYSEYIHSLTSSGFSTLCPSESGMLLQTLSSTIIPFFHSSQELTYTWISFSTPCNASFIFSLSNGYICASWRNPVVTYKFLWTQSSPMAMFALAPILFLPFSDK